MTAKTEEANPDLMRDVPSGIDYWEIEGARALELAESVPMFISQEADEPQ